MKTKLYQKTILNEKELEEIYAFLKADQIIAFPTETVYGLGCLLSSNIAAQKLFLLKQRKEGMFFTLHLKDDLNIEEYAKEVPEDFYKLSKAFLPGPLTVILKRKIALSNLISSNDTIGIRMPDCKVFQQLAHFISEPLIASSANFSQEVPLINGKDVFEKFQGKIAAVIDSGFAEKGLASTVISLVGSPKILRAGAIDQEKIEEVLKKKVAIL